MMYYVTTRYEKCDTEKCNANATHVVKHFEDNDREVFRGCRKHVMRQHKKLKKQGP